MPSAARRETVSGDRSALTNQSASRAIAGGGVLAGAKKPYHNSIS